MCYAIQQVMKGDHFRHLEKVVGDSYRDEIRRKKARSGYAAQEMVRSRAERRTALREQYFREPWPRYRAISAAAKRKVRDA